MLGQLGGGYGSVEVPVHAEDSRVRHISLICYPVLIHEVNMHLPGCRNMVMPKVVKTLKDSIVMGYTVHCRPKEIYQK